MSKSAHLLRKRWNNADGEKVGLWMAFGVFISIIVFALILATFNISLKFPFKRLSTLQQKDEESQNTIMNSEAEVARLKVTRTELQKTIGTLNTKISQDNATITAKNGKVLEQTRDIERLTAFETEANSLRPKIGEQQDEIRKLQKQVVEMRTQREIEKERNSQIAKRLAFASEELAELQSRNDGR